MPNSTDLVKQYRPEKLHEIGRRLYAQGDYAEALEFITAAINSQTRTNLLLFDLRAAIYVKLSKLDAALRDGKEMLELDKAYVQGYLRVGKILRLMDGKIELALKIYERGLRYCSVKNEYYPTLRRAHDQLSKSTASNQAVDFFTKLPLELVEIIFRDITFRQRCQCLRVSRRWNTFLRSWPQFWRKLDFSEASRNVPAKCIDAYINNAQKGILEAHIKNVRLQATQVLGKLISKCKGLEQLSILSGGEISTSLPRAVIMARNLRILHTSPAVQIDGSALKTIINSCANLSEVRCDYVIGNFGRHEPWKQGNFPKLRSYQLNMFSKHDPYEMSFEHICPPAIGLTTLDLNSDNLMLLCLEDCNLAGAMPELQKLHLSKLWIANAMYHRLNPLNGMLSLTLPYNLQSLKLISSGLFAKLSRPCGVRVDDSSKVAALSELILADDTGDVEVGVVQAFLNQPLSDAATKLLRFDIQIPLVTKLELQQLLVEPRLRNLEHLRFRACTEFDDDAAETVAENMQGLKLISLSHAKITGIGVKSLVQSLRKLATLKLVGCSDISADALDWARSKGVVVSNSLFE